MFTLAHLKNMKNNAYSAGYLVLFFFFLFFIFYLFFFFFEGGGPQDW